ncbi:WH1/EVH1 domain [Trinorchestia longiramus]|nr:WH1/EVH1 domain [Trinorchestia longiramus]
MEEILPLNLSSSNRSIIDREIGPETKILITGYADLAVMQPPRNDIFTMKASGLVIFSKDRRRRNFYIQVIDFVEEKLALDLKVCSALRYERNPQHPTAHTIYEEGNGISTATGLIFRDRIKADLFFKDVNERIMHLRMRRDERAARLGRPPVAENARVGLWSSESVLSKKGPIPLAKKKSDPSEQKKNNTQNKLEKLPNLSPPDPDEHPPDGGTSNGIFSRTKRTPKKQPKDGSTARPRTNPSVVTKAYTPQQQSKEPLRPPRSKPPPNLPEGEKSTSPSSSSSHSSLFMSSTSKLPLIPPNSRSFSSTTDFSSTPFPPTSQKPAVDRDKKSNSARTPQPLVKKTSPIFSQQFNPSQVLEFQKRIARFQNQLKFRPDTTEESTVRSPKAHENVHLNRSASQVDQPMKNSGLVFTNFNSQNTILHGRIRDTDSPSPPPPPPPPPRPSLTPLPPPSQSSNDSFLDSSMANNNLPLNPEPNFPPPPPPALLTANENLSPSESQSNSNLGAISPACGLENGEKQVGSPTNSDARVCLMAALQNDDPTKRLRKTSAQNLPRDQNLPAPVTNILDLMVQNLHVRRQAIDPIYLESSESDTDDEWSG